MSTDTPLVLVSNRGPVTFQPGGRDQARDRRARDGADRAGLTPPRDLGRVGDDRRGRRRGRAPRRAPVPGQDRRRRRVPGEAGRLRRPRLRRLLQHHRQPDAVVHPALPVGSVQRAGHPPQRDRGVRVRLQRRQRGPRARGARGGRGRRGAGGDGPRLPPVHASGPDPQPASGRVPAPLRPHPVEPVGLVARACRR